MRHYILCGQGGRILSGWSEGLEPERDTSGAILLTDSGGYQFRLCPGGRENPNLTNPDDTHRYIYDPALSPACREATPEEQEQERAEIEAARVPPGPSAESSIQQALTDLELARIENGQKVTDLEIKVLELTENVQQYQSALLEALHPPRPAQAEFEQISGIPAPTGPEAEESDAAQNTVFTAEI